MYIVVVSLLIRDADPMLVYCRASVADGGPTVNQHWVNRISVVSFRREMVKRPLNQFHSRAKVEFSLLIVSMQ